MSGITLETVNLRLATVTTPEDIIPIACSHRPRWEWI